MNLNTGTPINKYHYLLNDKVPISAFAESEERARERVKGLFGKHESYDLIDFTFSHHVGDYAIKRPAVKAAPAIEYSVTERPVKRDLMTNVMDAYAKDKLIKL